MIRLPAVAGQFYSAAEDELRAAVARVLSNDQPQIPAVAAIAPHAAMMYSGSVAGSVYERLALPSSVILVGPNHTGRGPAVSVFPDGHWVIPGAEIPIDRDLTARLLSRFSAAHADTTAHQLEHCLELQLPFLVYGRGMTGAAQGSPRPPKIVAVVLGTTRLETCRELGVALAQLVLEETALGTPPPLLIASSDMTHYESDETTRRKDGFAIEAIKRVDAGGLHATAQQHEITMCGLGPVVAILTAARAVHARWGSLVRYATSGDVSGDHDRVVGYAGFLINR